MNVAELKIPPEKQPPGGWKLKLQETGGMIEGDTFDTFCRTVNGHLAANGHKELSQKEILRRATHS